MSDIAKKWYVLRAIGGKEKKAKEYIESEIARLNLQEYVSQVLIPTENVEKFNILGQDAYLIYQEQKWSCPVCGGRVTFYDYQCQECGKQTFE